MDWKWIALIIVGCAGMLAALAYWFACAVYRAAMAGDYDYTSHPPPHSHQPTGWLIRNYNGLIVTIEPSRRGWTLEISEGQRTHMVMQCVTDAEARTLATQLMEDRPWLDMDGPLKGGELRVI